MGRGSQHLDKRTVEPHLFLCFAQGGVGRAGVFRIGAPPEGNLPGMGGQVCRALRQQHHGLLAQDDGQQTDAWAGSRFMNFFSSTTSGSHWGGCAKRAHAIIGRLRRQRHGGRQVRIHPLTTGTMRGQVGQARQRRDDR